MNCGNRVLHQPMPAARAVTAFCPTNGYLSRLEQARQWGTGTPGKSRFPSIIADVAYAKSHSL